MDAMTALALGAGLQSLGTGWQEMRDRDALRAERDRILSGQEADRKERQSIQKRQERQRERQARIAALRAYDAGRNVYRTLDEYEREVDAEEASASAPSPAPAMPGANDIGFEPRGRGTLPDGVDPFAPNDTGFRADGASSANDTGFRPRQDPSTAMEALIAEASRLANETGDIQYLPGGRGYVVPQQGRRQTPQAQTPQPEWVRNGFATEAEYLAYLRRRGNATRTPERPRASAGGERASAGEPEPSLTVSERSRVQAQDRAVRDMDSALTNFENAIAGGIDLMPGANRANAETTYRLVQMQLKNLLELGVLAGPDMEIIEGIITPPTSVMLNAQRALGRNPSDVLKAQVQQLREYLRNKRQNFLPSGGPQRPGSVVERYNLERPE